MRNLLKQPKKEDIAMKRNKTGLPATENLASTRQKKYQRKVKGIPEEQQTLLKEVKKRPASAVKTEHIINKAWHETHKMPKYPTLQERIDWHLEHAAQCGCRPIPDGLLREMEKRGIRQTG